MVEHRTVERFSGRDETPGRPEVAFARPRIAAGMIVSKDEARASMSGGVGDDLSQREIRAVLVTLMARHMKTAGLLVDMRNPQILAGRIGIGHAPGEELAGRRKPVELQREFGTLIPHAP